MSQNAPLEWTAQIGQWVVRWRWPLSILSLVMDASFAVQLTGAAVIFTWTAGASLVVWYGLKRTVGIRVDAEDEQRGLDLAECGLEAYPEFVHGRIGRSGGAGGEKSPVGAEPAQAPALNQLAPE